MGRYSDTGWAHGPSGSKQLSIEQLEYALAADRVEAEIERVVNQEIISSMLDELDYIGAKYNIENIQFITRDATGQVVWLEKGNQNAGLEHIITRHAKDFMNKLGIEKQDIATTLFDIVRTGQVISNKTKVINGRLNHEKIYKLHDQYYVLTGIGSNGFLVSAYPIKVKGA